MKRFSLFALLLSALVAKADPIPVKVVVLSMFEPGADTGDVPGEFQYWVEREHLDRVWDNPAGFHSIRGTEDGSVIATVTGMGTARSAASVMALGLDQRFDFSHAYWLVAGIAGIDPADGSIGSAVWAEWVVDGDFAHEIDAREIPADWPTGYLPMHQKKPYEGPVDRSLGQAFQLETGLVHWAYGLTKDIALQQTEGMRIRNALYKDTPAAQQPPRVMLGDTLQSMTYWHGKYMNQWANDWVRYYTDGKGNYVTTAMEDTGTLTSLTWLAKAGRVDLKRVLVLRTASNYDMQWPGATAVESLTGDMGTGAYAAYKPSLDAAQKVGSAVVHALVKDWETYKTSLPKP